MPWVLAALVLLAGCVRRDRQPSADETAEPEYQRGLQLEKQGRPQEALAAYLKVIAQRGEESAPESHLQAGVICLQHGKDPLEAIWHFKKYLAHQANPQRAELVRQQIEAAKRDFARTLLAQPLENPSDRIRLQDQITSLQRENDQLKSDLAAARGGAAVPRTSSGPGETAILLPTSRPRPAGAPPAGDAPVTLVPFTPAVVAGNAPGPSAPPKAAPRQPMGKTSPKPAAPAPSTRKYAVQVKDTLFKIAQRYPGTGTVSARARAIYDANRDVMKSDTDLRPGMELRIP